MSASFIVTGMVFDPNECTLSFGVKPTKILVKGEFNPRANIFIPQSSWNLQSKKERLDSTDMALQPIIEEIWPKRKQIRDFARKNKLEITLTVNITGGLGKRNFLYEFLPVTLQRMAYFRAPLFIDVY